MSKIKTTFLLADKFSGAAIKISDKLNAMSTKLGSTSKNLDKLSSKMTSTGNTASSLTGKILKLVAGLATLAMIKQGISLSDEYISMEARLGGIAKGSETVAGLQDKIYNSAQRSRGAYDAMASSVIKLANNAGNAFSGNDEIIAFMELMNKQFALSGTSGAQLEGVMLQLSQAMASGALRGDELNSVLEGAPELARLIEKSMDWDTGSIKKYAEEGKVTTDVVKNAVLGASEEINGKFESMPMTFAQSMTQLKNYANKTFSDVWQGINGLLNSDFGQGIITGLVGTINIASGVANMLVGAIKLIGDNISWLTPIIATLSAMWLVYNATAGIAWLTTMQNVAATVAKMAADWLETAAIIAMTIAQNGLNAALAMCPITWIIMAIIALVGALYAGVAMFNHFAGASVSATGIIGGVIGTLVGVISNIFVTIWNLIADFINFFANVFNDPISSVKILFYDLAITVIGYVSDMAKVIEGIINKIPGVEVNISAGLDSFKSGLERQVNEIKDASGWEEFVKKKEYTGSTFGEKGYEMGAKAESAVGDFVGGMFSTDSGNFGDFGSMGDLSYDSTGATGTASNPATVKGTGSGGAVKVENQEDIEWMRKLAEREYVARIAQNTLAPNIKVEFNGPITEKADLNGVLNHINDSLTNIIAVAPMGVS